MFPNGRSSSRLYSVSELALHVLRTCRRMCRIIAQYRLPMSHSVDIGEFVVIVECLNRFSTMGTNYNCVVYSSWVVSRLARNLSFVESWRNMQFLLPPVFLGIQRLPELKDSLRHGFSGRCSCMFERSIALHLLMCACLMCSSHI